MQTTRVSSCTQRVAAVQRPSASFNSRPALFQRAVVVKHRVRAEPEKASVASADEVCVFGSDCHKLGQRWHIRVGMMLLQERTHHPLYTHSRSQQQPVSQNQFGCSEKRHVNVPDRVGSCPLVSTCWALSLLPLPRYDGCMMGVLDILTQQHDEEWLLGVISTNWILWVCRHKHTHTHTYISCTHRWALCLNLQTRMQFSVLCSQTIFSGHPFLGCLH